MSLDKITMNTNANKDMHISTSFNTSSIVTFEILLISVKAPLPPIPYSSNEIYSNTKYKFVICSF